MKGLLLLTALIFGILCGLATAEASILITSVEVDVGPGVWCNVGNASPSCAGAITPWNLGGGILLQSGQSLVLTQTSGYNFDTSDGCPASGPACTSVVKINGLSFSDSSNVLGNAHLDPVTLAHNEAHDWLGLGAAALFSVSAAYADNLHTNACADANATCLPENPFADAIVFQGSGSGVIPAGFTVGGHCSFSAGTCFDAGAILIRAVPEPASWLLMGLGLLVSGLALRKRRV